MFTGEASTTEKLLYNVQLNDNITKALDQRKIVFT